MRNAVEKRSRDGSPRREKRRLAEAIEFKGRVVYARETPLDTPAC